MLSIRSSHYCCATAEVANFYTLPKKDTKELHEKQDYIQIYKTHGSIFHAILTDTQLECSVIQGEEETWHEWLLKMGFKCVYATLNRSHGPSVLHFFVTDPGPPIETRFFQKT